MPTPSGSCGSCCNSTGLMRCRARSVRWWSAGRSTGSSTMPPSSGRGCGTSSPAIPITWPRRSDDHAMGEREAMSADDDGTDIRKSFHQQLQDVQHDIVRMAAMVTEAVPRGTAALLEGDLHGAQELIEGDDPLD